MVRPRAENYEERRQELLDAAASMFAEKGFDGASMAQIANSCGVSKALLYHYYKSKEELLYSMLLSHCLLLVRTGEEAVANVDLDQSFAGSDQDKARARARARVQLDSLVRSLMQLYIESRDKHVVLLNNLHALPPEQQLEIKQLEKNLVAIIKGLLKELKPGATEAVRTALAMYLMGAVNWTYTWFKSDGPVSHDEYASLATSTFLHGIEAG